MKSIPYGHQLVDQDDIKEVVKVLKSDWITQGPKIREFEDALCGYTGANYAVAVSSGTAALHIACLATEVKSGDEVITSPMTFAASANCALYCGARPVFADVRMDDINIDPEEIEKKITKKTSTVIPVHFAGHPCRMDVIYKIAKKHKLIVIEDAAHALGAKYNGSKIGSCRYSDMAIFSFHPVKSITTGEGGAVLTNNKRFYERLLLFRNHGITKDKSRMHEYEGPWYYEMQVLGFNYRMTDIQAALGFSQLEKVDNFIEKRQKIADMYNKAFYGNEFFDIPIKKKGVSPAYHLYPIRLKDRIKSKRDNIFMSLRNSNIGAQVHYMPVYLQPYYRKLGFKKGFCPIAENYYKKEISIPIYPDLTNRQVKYVIDTVFKVFRRL